MEEIKMRCTMKQMTLYSYLKNGTLFKLDGKKYKFVTYAFDFENTSDTIDLIVVKDIDSNKYKVLELSYYENEMAEIIEEK